MDILAQRELGLRLMQQLGADATRSIIGNKDSDYSAIFTAAARELKPGQLVDAVLEGPPEWAYYALRDVSNLSTEDQARLAERAADDPLTAVNALRTVRGLDAHTDLLTEAAGVLAASQGTISGFYLNNKGSYNCEFTMYWVDNGKIQPAAGSSSGLWKWSPKLMVGQDAQMACTEFALTDSPLNEGDTVWMYMWVQAGKDIESPLRFTYSSTTADYAWFTSSGCTQNDSLALDKVDTPPATVTNKVAEPA